MIDPFIALNKYLTAEGFGPVYTEMPNDQPLPRLPCVDLWPVAKSTAQHAFNAMGYDVHHIDVDLYLPRAMVSVTGEGYALADRLRKTLFAFRDPRIRVRHVTAPHRRPDRNRDIRRLGLTITLIIPQKG